MTDRSDAETIAAGLTKSILPGEMAAFMWLPADGAWCRKHPHDEPPADYPSDALFCLWANKSKLIEGEGLTTGFFRYRLTPLGSEVRRHLLEGADNAEG